MATHILGCGHALAHIWRRCDPGYGEDIFQDTIAHIMDIGHPYPSYGHILDTHVLYMAPSTFDIEDKRSPHIISHIQGIGHFTDKLQCARCHGNQLGPYWPSVPNRNGPEIETPDRIYKKEAQLVDPGGPLHICLVCFQSHLRACSGELVIVDTELHNK